MSPFDPFNPIGGDNFQIGRPMPEIPKPHGHKPKRAVPDVDELFAAQKAIIRAINHLRDAPQSDVHVQRALERAEGGYKRLRNWLAQHGNEGRA